MRGSRCAAGALAAVLVAASGCPSSSTVDGQEGQSAAPTVAVPEPVPPEPAATPPAVDPAPPPPPAETSTPAAPGGRADGAACSKAADCASGVCEGQGCGPDEGRCQSKMRMCTRDLRPYCGCDGKTFQSSGSCPGRTYARPGPC